MTRPSSCMRQNSVKRVAAVAALLAMNAAGNAIPITAQELSPALQRLERGDYVWTTDFPRENMDFLAYVLAFIKQVRSDCPSEYPRSFEEEMFGWGWLHGKPNPLNAFRSDSDLYVHTKISPIMLAIEDDAEAEAQRLGSNACPGSMRLQRLMENASRLLTGRRAAHGGPGETNLINESVARPNANHNYALGKMVSSELTVLDQQLAELASRGYQVLECRYDSDPKDADWEVQYYWTGPVATLSQLYLVDICAST